jgi:hypothetical protein
VASFTLVFRCKITGGNLATNDETAAFRRASKHDIRELATEAYAVRILDALSPKRVTRGTYGRRRHKPNSMPNVASARVTASARKVSTSSGAKACPAWITQRVVSIR